MDENIIQNFLPRNKSHQIFSYSEVDASMSVPDSEEKILKCLVINEPTNGSAGTSNSFGDGAPPFLMCDPIIGHVDVSVTDEVFLLQKLKS
jgi:hypothetical protein